jgi:two-component sensor histidine kinase
MDGTVRGVIGTSVDISDRKQIEQNLQQSLREKDVLLSEIHHRVKNNLQVIVSLLNLQALRIDDPDVQQVLEQSGDRVHAMALVHEKLYRTQHFEGISLSDYIREFVDHLVQGHTAADCNVEIHYRLNQSIDLPLAQAIQFSLILNELVTNALKHGSVLQDEQQHLYVELTRSGDRHIVLRVGNTGRPLPGEFSLNTPRLSMGLQLIQVLADQINGNIHVESTTPDAQPTAVNERSPITWFMLSIPLAQRQP